MERQECTTSCTRCTNCKCAYLYGCSPDCLCPDTCKWKRRLIEDEELKKLEVSKAIFFS